MHVRRFAAVRTVIAVGTAAICVGFFLGLPAGPAGAFEAADARARHRGAAADLAEIQGMVTAAARQLDATETRLRGATTTLAALDAALADATQAHDEARHREAEATSRLREIDRELQSLLIDHERHLVALSRRVADVFKYGRALPQDLLVRGVSDADHWHDVVVTAETVQRLAAEEQASLDRAAKSTRAVAAMRADADKARTTAVATAAEASRRETEVAELRNRQADVTDQLAREEAARAQLLANFEQDARAKAALVAHLEQQVERFDQLERARQQAAATASDHASAHRPDLDVRAAEGPLDGPAPAWSRGLPADGQALAPLIDAAAARYSLDPRLLAALVWTESNFRADVVSHAGAIGLCQLMPGTARGLGVDPYDPVQNLDGGARYLRAQLDRFGRNDLALAAYNAGPGRVRNAIPDVVETQLYVVRILQRYEQLTR